MADTTRATCNGRDTRRSICKIFRRYSTGDGENNSNQKYLVLCWGILRTKLHIHKLGSSIRPVERDRLEDEAGTKL